MQFGRNKTLMDRAQDYAGQVSDTVRPQVESAWEQAVDKAGPVLSDARDRAIPIIEDGKAYASEKAHLGAALAAEKASAGAGYAADKAAEGRDLAAAKAVEQREEAEPKGGKLKKFLLVAGVLAIGGFVYTKLRGQKNESANWQTSYVPSPPPSGASTTGAPLHTPTVPVPPAPPATGGDPLTDPLGGESADIGGGSPGEAISDSVEEPQSASTPENPADVVDIDDDKGFTP